MSAIMEATRTGERPHEIDWVDFMDWESFKKVSTVLKRRPRLFPLLSVMSRFMYEGKQEFWKGWKTHCEMKHNNSISVHAGWRTEGRRREASWRNQRERGGGEGFNSVTTQGVGGTGYAQVRGWTAETGGGGGGVLFQPSQLVDVTCLHTQQCIAGCKFSEQRHLRNVSTHCRYKHVPPSVNSSVKTALICL